MAPSTTPPQSLVTTFNLAPQTVAVYLLLVAAAVTLILIRRRRAQTVVQHVEDQPSCARLAPDEKPRVPELYQSLPTTPAHAMPLPPPDIPSPFLWEFPPAPPMSQLNSGDLARIAKSRMRSGPQSQGIVEETLRRHSYPVPSELENHDGAEMAENIRAMRRRETIQFFGGVGPQDRIWKRRTLEFE